VRYGTADGGVKEGKERVCTRCLPAHGSRGAVTHPRLSFMQRPYRSNPSMKMPVNVYGHGSTHDWWRPTHTAFGNAATCSVPSKRTATNTMLATDKGAQVPRQPER
jgi:hypothetical protein